MTIKNASIAMQCSERTVMRMVRSGKIEFIRVGAGSKQSLRVKLPEPQVATALSPNKRKKAYVGKFLDIPSGSPK